MKSLLLSALFLLSSSCATLRSPSSPPLPPWAAFSQPYSPPDQASAQIFGSYANGCITGAVRIPEQTEGYELVNLSRNRAWGHPDALELLEAFGRWSRQQGFGKMLAGDISQPLGFPMITGHASHQVGLDIDLRFDFTLRDLTREEKEGWPGRPVAIHQLETGNGTQFSLSSSLTPDWDERFREALRFAAEWPKTERIFISPPIKRKLCEKFTGATGYPQWLRKLRPYYEHTAHFHVRLACPPGSPGCEPQKAVEIDPTDPTKVGCAGEELAFWFETDPGKKGYLKEAIEDFLKRKDSPEPPKDWKAKEEKLPSRCRELLQPSVVRLGVS